MRFLALCALLVALGAGAVLLVAQVGPLLFPPEEKSTQGPGKKDPSGGADPGPRSPARPAETPAAAAAEDDNADVEPVPVPASAATAAPLVLQDGRVQPEEKQDVPSKREGQLLFLATPVLPGESVPPHKLVEFEVSILAVVAGRDEQVPDDERILNPLAPQLRLRKARSTDSLAPGTTSVVRRKVQLRKLGLGDRIQAGQLLGVIDPALAGAEMVSKQRKIEGNHAEVLMAEAMKREYERRAAQMGKLRKQMRNTVADDEYYAAVATAERYGAEAQSKREAVKQAQSELLQAWTTLQMHELRASIDGVIKALYKENGEAVQNNVAVLQIQNPNRLRVEAQVEVQDALDLRHRLKEARKYREEARLLALRGNEPAARQKRAEAEALLAVEVEASRVDRPRAVLSGHLQPVTCVAVSSGKTPKIVSGSEDQTVRIWERVAGSETRWKEQCRLDHRAVVRAVACTGRGAQRNLLLTATASGRGRIFDLDDLKKRVSLGERHAGAINAVAFNDKGTLCASGGEDRSVCLWETAEGKLLARVRGAHRAGVTSLSFTRQGQLVSVGDRRILIWNVEKDGQELKQAAALERRSGEVGQLGVDPAGQYVLFDEGRELRVMSLATQRMEGALSNPVGTPSFSTLALYSPDGHTILTNGNAAGRLQLWRAPSNKTRAAELRNFVWTAGTVTSAAFDPAGSFVATGTQDSRVLVWEMPSKAEAEKPLPAQLTYVEEFLDTSLRKVAARATFESPDWIIPGGSATIVVLPRPRR